MQLPFLGGGFVGVDVFFVISGFLIAGLIYEELAAGTFTFSGFYERRVRRILPALLFVTALTAAAAWTFLWPVEMVAFAKSAVWSLAFLPNVYFHRHTGYFDPAASTLPLLHFWSLGVEEQFYIAFPIFVAVIAKVARRWLAPLLIVGLLGSLAWSEYRTLILPGSAFYLPQFRAWELLIGCTLALPGFPRASSRLVRGLAGGVGLAGILAAAVVYSTLTPFPGAAALLPTVGAALVIWSGGGPVAWLLSLRPATYVGKISYSLYLVHWPVIVFSMQLFPHLDPAERITAILALTFSVAVLSYHLVEQPVRRRRFLAGRTALFVGALTMTALFMAGAAAVMVLDGLPGRIPPQIQVIEAYLKYPYEPLYRLDTCFLRPEQGFTTLDQGACLPKGTRRSVVLWGDSLAAHYYPGFVSVFAGDDIEIGEATASACPPVVGLSVADRPNCKTFNEGVYDLLRRHPPSVVILSADWGRSGLDDVEGLPATIAGLVGAGSKVVVLGPGPVYGDVVPSMIARDMAAHLPVQGVEADFVPTLLPAERAMAASLASRADLLFVSILDELCRDLTCPLLVDAETPIHWDQAHFTKEGSVVVTRLFADRIRALLK